MDRLTALREHEHGEGGGRRPRSISAPQRHELESPIRGRAPTPPAAGDADQLSPPAPEPGIRHARTFASTNSQSASGLRRRGTTTSFRPRTSANLARRTTGMSSGSDTPSANFTLAGPQNPVAVAHQHQPYVDPGYTDLNPAYEQPASARPVWSLAKPMPRVVRPGMVPTASELDVSQPSTEVTDADVEKGVEPTLRLNRVSTKLKEVNAEREKRFVEKYSTQPRRSGSISRVGSRRSDTGEGPVQQAPEILPGVAEEDEQGDLGEASLDGLSQRPSSLQVSNHAAYEFDDSFSSQTALDEVPDEDFVPLKAYNGLEDELHNAHTHWSMVRIRFREPLAELLAVFVQLTLGFSADLAYTVGGATNGDITNFAWGFASMVGIYIAGGISGAHLNPTISLVLYIFRGFPKRKLPEFVLAQLLGAFLAGLVAYAVYKSDIDAYVAAAASDAESKSKAIQAVANGFITNRRNPNINAAYGFFNEFVATAFLAIIIMALGDDANAPPGAGMNAVVIGFVIVVLSQAFACNTGVAMNPTRDFGPRLSLLVLGFGGDRLFGDGWWIYGPIAGPIAGSIVGAAVYDLCIFTGGESPINYPRKRIWRSAHKFERRWKRRLGLAKNKAGAGAGGETENFPNYNREA